MADFTARLDYDKAVFKRLGLQVEQPVPADGSPPQLFLVVAADMTNSQGLCHGAILFALADTVCAWELAAAEMQPATVDASITYLRAAAIGEKVSARARLLKRGRRAGTCVVDLLGNDERLLANYRGTCLDVSS